ncbi:MAG: DUF3795 domain-containing protein [Actinobacteria bacterium]|nr:DUF3795 domain-containing protein [Actinomycetota bacterium]
MTPDALEASMIAPCGMNCGICIHFLSEKRSCNGCNGDDSNKPEHCIVCEIKKCTLLNESGKHFCFECDEYSCEHLKAQDEHERNVYGFSLIENLESIRDLGIDPFLATERDRWRCEECGGLISVYSEKCIFCGCILRY